MRRGFFQSTTFRLALALLLVQVAALALGLTIIHRFTEATILADARTAAEVARDDFAEEYKQEGEAGLVRALRDRLAARDDQNFVVLLKGPDGAPIVGNLKQWPATVGEAERWRRISLFREGGLAAEEMGIVTTRLPAGRVLLTGEVLEAQAQLARASQAAFLYALAAGILLAASVAAIGAWILARRVDAFARAASAIAGGKLDARVVRDETGDAFDRLGVSINAMLDRIEALVGELRMVTDSMAHDLRSPVSRMKATLEQALGRTRDESATTALAGAIDEADSLHRLLDTALEISRAEAGIGRGQFTRFALAPLLEDLAEVYGPLAEDEGFAIDVAAPGDLEVTAHREMLLRALSNLIDNALKYAGGGTTIGLAAARDGEGEIIVSVTDDGPGIPDAILEDIFDPFVSGRENGTGLGLALVSRIISDHEGWIGVESQPGRTTFRIALPKASETNRKDP